ncbi:MULTISPECIES: CidA/LrgA family protein [Thermoactinomyces]|uniref:CidA/LrgA family protein n=1 Tax=Thermoactinomyces daqus TaxID=1329516 RepID=A0A7W2AH11_9BACL|nr:MULTISPECIES: CidA/LrgA family protein [Thermoactinomyces]MBA4542206.1 CidA/LrgA family protein [Thermoactinomyces daqus]MBH8598343.1 CidA/LrgA family protein [Thermoactinomyces sp. CICC 10523]MBH8604467.1 CidA/LrgA family protein [Thermoactinomyces sp. CICC 10522]MBH8607532.1 CidA/LrgA family protein [Thermoactinomyces sp. CICC 10521]
MRIWIVLGQILLINLVYLCGEGIAHLLRLEKLPGSIIGLALLFLLLKLRIIRLEWVEEGAKWLLAELLLFFIPPTVGIIQFPQIMGVEGLRMAGAVWISLIAVMCITGLVAEFLQKRKKGKA